MKKLVFFPSDPIVAYIEKGRTYNYLDEYYNPNGYFDEVYCLSPWGDRQYEKIGKIHYIKAKPWQFAKIIKKLKPDVVRGYGGYCCADWVSVNKVRGIPTVVSVHDTNPKLIHDSLKYADALICMSEAVKDAVLKKVNIDSSCVYVMPNRIDATLFRKKTDSGYFGELNHRFGAGKHVLHVGRKTEQKNIDTVIRAMQYLDDDHIAIFVGAGDSTRYVQLAEHCNVASRCKFIKSVPNCELPYWYSWCDCFCTPSRWEGFGFVFIEAAACEAAVVTSNIGPMNEYFTDGLDSILVDNYEDPASIAKAILKAESNSAEIRQMRKNARNVGLKFEKKVVDQQEVKVYEQVIRMKPNNRFNLKMRYTMIAKDCLHAIHILLWKVKMVLISSAK